MQAAFTSPDGRTTYSVPGFFDGDGNGGGTGTIFRARFTPDASGDWQYQVSFRRGNEVAVDLNPNAGTPVEGSFHNTTGSFSVGGLNQSAPGFLRFGRLEYTGTHYLKFRDGPYWVKGGANEPENFLGYTGFDNTQSGSFTHNFNPHVNDWRSGDPDWDNGAGRGIVGALNYLSGIGVNSIYFLPMNAGGDANDTWPFVSRDDVTHYDVSKLRQWETVFAHAQRRGLFLHVVFNEAEGANKRHLDNATLGASRKLFYREMVARFGHHLGLQWNMSEEYDFDFPLSPDTIKEWAGYVQAVDPYDHPITVHNNGHPDRTWTPFLGDSRFSMTSFQWPQGDNPADPLCLWGSYVDIWRQKTAAAGRPLPISLDECFGVNDNDAYFDGVRKVHVWPTLLSGGMLELIVGPSPQIGLEDFRRWDRLWRELGYARRFVTDNLPFWEMTGADQLIAGASTERVTSIPDTTDFSRPQVFARENDTYAIYLPDGTPSGQIDLSRASGGFQLRWYSPRTGQFVGAARTITGGGLVELGSPPGDSEDNEDWAVLIRR